MAEVNLDSIQPNSHKARQENPEERRRKATPVISRDEVVSSKKSTGKKILETFVNTDKDAIKDWLIWDMIVPGIQDFGFELLKMIFMRDFDDRRGGSDHRNYRGYYGRSSYGDRRRRSGRSREIEEDRDVDYRNVIIKSRSAAEELVDDLQDRIDRNGEVSVAEFLDMIGEDSKYTDTHYGWTRANQIGLKKTSRGWLIDVDEAKYIS